MMIKQHRSDAFKREMIKIKLYSLCIDPERRREEIYERCCLSYYHYIGRDPTATKKFTTGTLKQNFKS